MSKVNGSAEVVTDSNIQCRLLLDHEVPFHSTIYCIILPHPIPTLVKAGSARLGTRYIVPSTQVIMSSDTVTNVTAPKSMVKMSLHIQTDMQYDYINDQHVLA